MAALRLGDDIDDYCVKCKRLTNHVIVALVDGEPAKVRCRSCYAEQQWRKGEAPPSKKDLRKAALFEAVLAKSPGMLPVEEPAAEVAPEAEAPATPAKKTRKKA
jgi:hypothetical protein